MGIDPSQPLICLKTKQRTYLADQTHSLLFFFHYDFSYSWEKKQFFYQFQIMWVIEKHL